MYFFRRKENSLLLYARLPNANAVGKSVIISLLRSDLCGSISAIQPNIQLTIQQWHGVETLLALKQLKIIICYQTQKKRLTGIIRFTLVSKWQLKSSSNCLDFAGVVLLFL